MKVACSAVLLFAATAYASEPNKALGTKLGDILAGTAGDEGFQHAFQDQVMGSMPVTVNPAVSEVIRAANDKAAHMQSASFLQVPSGINIHIADTPSYEAAAAAELAHAQRKKLLAILKEEAHQKEILGAAIAGGNLGSEAATSFLQGAGDVQYQAGQFDISQSAISSYSADIKAGGYRAQRAIAALTNLMSEPNAKVTGQLLSLPLLNSLRVLALKESTPDQLRIAAGSIITSLTGMPFSATAVETVSGGYGHTNIVLPSPSRVYDSDYQVLAAREGAKSNYYGASFLKKNKDFPFKMPEELLGDINKGAATINVIAESGEDAEGQEMLKSIQRAA